MQGKAGGFDWENVGEATHFDFVMSKDEEDGKLIVFMLVEVRCQTSKINHDSHMFVFMLQEQWLGEDDPADIVVDTWTTSDSNIKQRLTRTDSTR
jgi:hypothetical protein